MKALVRNKTVLPDEDLRGRNVLLQSTLLVTCSTSLLKFEAVARSLHHISTLQH